MGLLLPLNDSDRCSFRFYSICYNNLRRHQLLVLVELVIRGIFLHFYIGTVENARLVLFSTG